MRDEQDTTQSYVVFEFPGGNQSDLFQRTLAEVNKWSRIEKHVEVIVVDKASILISGETEPTRISGYHVYLKYVVSLDFKDNRMKYSVHDITFDAKGSAGEVFKVKASYKRGNFKSSIYSLEGDLISEEGKRYTEGVFNGIANRIITNFQEWDKW